MIGLFFKQSCSFLFHLFFLSITRRNFKKQTRTLTRSSKTYTRKRTTTNKVKANRNDDDQSGGGNTQRRQGTREKNSCNLFSSFFIEKPPFFSLLSFLLYLARLRRRNAGISIPSPPLDEEEAAEAETAGIESSAAAAAAVAEATSLGAEEETGALDEMNGATAAPARPPSPKPVAISVIESSPEAARAGSTTAPKMRLASGSTRS